MTTTKQNRASYPFSSLVDEALDVYFKKLDGEPTTDLYELVLSEVEQALLEAVMMYTKGNQSQAATYLGLSRGTLRKKLLKYHLA
jgi:Fis family transcriptional regulator